ncbi:fibronectin type III domain-containing protein [Paenibacillus larvae]|nr:fibronectin type III domain-containing protein [Paenibacillus larvae]MDT2277705.1 fibronectin type III domain-containing protein [Paenibacillus larvae]
MKKCVFLFAFVLFFSLPFVVSAKFGDPVFEGGLLGSLTPVIKDDFVRYDLGKNYTIDSLYLNQDDRYDYVRFLDKDKKLIKRFMTSSGFDSVGVKEVYHIGVTIFVNPVENVRYVEYIGKPPIKLQMDVKGTEQPGVPPDMPSNLTVVSGDGQVTLHWDAVSNAETYTVYVDGVYYRGTSDTSLTIDNLTNGKEYQFSVSAVSDGLESQRISVFGTPEVPKLPPDVPTNLSVTAGDASLVLNWKGSLGVKYRVYLDGEMIAEIDRTSYSLTDLENDHSYLVQVSAVNSVGESEKTSAVTGIPKAGKVPAVKFKYSLADVARAIAEWFGSIWPVVAFSVSIPLSFIVSSRIKQLFT